SDVATARSVQVAGTSSNFFLSSSSELVAVVPAGARTGNVSIETTAGRTESSFPFNVTGAISVGPSIVDFGRVVGGQVGEPKTVAIRNLGSRPLKINSLTPSTSDFQLASSLMLPLTIAPSESIEVAVRFQPSSTGKVDGSLRVVSDDPILPNLNIALTGQVGDFALRLVAPQQGLKLRAGDSFVIQWQAESSDITEFELRLSSDSGRTFATQIASGLTSSTRSFIWTVPSVKTKTARVAIIAKTQSGTVFVDQSRGDFRIKTKK
ncbi:MAG: choice-of-anchor D domain-containing protein, partial [Blastocatellia bacterium]|nr:choice-of-anchor D domain-containing protein [Blastocatellia bacterium]